MLATEHLESDEQTTVADQSRSAKPRVEEQTSPGELEVHATREMVLEPRVLTKTEPTCLGESSYPRAPEHTFKSH